jgi:hypothetical protein
MREPNTIHPSPGLCSLQDLPEPYQFAFRQGSAHHLPGQFLPAEVDWFTQIFLLPFWLMYALPPLALPVILFNLENYGRFFQIVRQQTAVENALMMGLFGLLGVLLVYLAWMAWDGGSSFIRTWQAHQLQQRNEHGFGMVLLEHGMAARLIDNIGGHNCFWLPRKAIADIIWQRIREEGAKHSRWVYRTRLCYVTEHRGKQQKRWLTLRGDMVKTGYPMGDSKGDRALFDRLYDWWQTSE